MDHPAIRRTMDVVLRCLTGGWFAYSGFEKIFLSGLDRFVYDIGNYRIWFVKPPMDAVAAYTIPWLEVVAGAMLVLGVCRRGAVMTLAGLVSVFSFCVGWAWYHQLNISCGCRGDGAPIQYWWKAAEFLGYGLAFWILSAMNRPDAARGNAPQGSD